MTQYPDDIFSQMVLMNFCKHEYVARAQNPVSLKHSIQLKPKPSKKMIFMVFFALCGVMMPGHVMGVETTPTEKKKEYSPSNKEVFSPNRLISNYNKRSIGSPTNSSTGNNQNFLSPDPTSKPNEELENKCLKLIAFLTKAIGSEDGTVEKSKKPSVEIGKALELWSAIVKERVAFSNNNDLMKNSAPTFAQFKKTKKLYDDEIKVISNFINNFNTVKERFLKANSANKKTTDRKLKDGVQRTLEELLKESEVDIAAQLKAKLDELKKEKQERDKKTEGIQKQFANLYQTKMLRSDSDRYKGVVELFKDMKTLLNKKGVSLKYLRGTPEFNDKGSFEDFTKWAIEEKYATGLMKNYSKAFEYILRNAKSKFEELLQGEFVPFEDDADAKSLERQQDELTKANAELNAIDVEYTALIKILENQGSPEICDKFYSRTKDLLVHLLVRMKNFSDRRMIVKENSTDEIEKSIKELTDKEGSDDFENLKKILDSAYSAFFRRDTKVIPFICNDADVPLRNTSNQEANPISITDAEKKKVKFQGVKTLAEPSSLNAPNTLIKKLSSLNAPQQPVAVAVASKIKQPVAVALRQKQEQEAQALAEQKRKEAEEALAEQAVADALKIQQNAQALKVAEADAKAPEDREAKNDVNKQQEEGNGSDINSLLTISDINSLLKINENLNKLLKSKQSKQFLEALKNTLSKVEQDTLKKITNVTNAQETLSSFTFDDVVSLKKSIEKKLTHRQFESNKKDLLKTLKDIENLSIYSKARKLKAEQDLEAKKKVEQKAEQEKLLAEQRKLEKGAKQEAKQEALAQEALEQAERRRLEVAISINTVLEKLDITSDKLKKIIEDGNETPLLGNKDEKKLYQNLDNIKSLEKILNDSLKNEKFLDDLLENENNTKSNAKNDAKSIVIAAKDVVNNANNFIEKIKPIIAQQKQEADRKKKADLKAKEEAEQKKQKAERRKLEKEAKQEAAKKQKEKLEKQQKEEAKDREERETAKKQKEKLEKQQKEEAEMAALQKEEAEMAALQKKESTLVAQGLNVSLVEPQVIEDQQGSYTHSVNALTNVNTEAELERQKEEERLKKEAGVQENVNAGSDAGSDAENKGGQQQVEEAKKKLEEEQKAQDALKVAAEALAKAEALKVNTEQMRKVQEEEQEAERKAKEAADALKIQLKEQQVQRNSISITEADVSMDRSELGKLTAEMVVKQGAALADRKGVKTLEDAMTVKAVPSLFKTAEQDQPVELLAQEVVKPEVVVVQKQDQPVAEQDTEQEEQPQAEQKTEQKLEKEALAKKKQQQLADQKAAEVKQNATMTSMIPYILAARQQASANVAPQQGAQSTTASTPATHTSSSSTTFTGPFTASALPPERFEALLNLVETAEQKDLIVNGLATMFITLTPEQIQKLDEKIAKSTSQQTGQQNLTNQQDVQQGGAKTLTVSEFLQGLGNAKAENGVMKGVKKSISDIKTLSALRKFKNELNKLMKGINPTFRPLLNKKPNKAAVARRTKQQNQWIASVKTWLNKLNQSDQSALGLTIHPTDNPITLALSQRKPIINAFSALLKDLNQQNTTIIKANRAKKLAKQEELRAKKKTKKAEEKNKGRNRRRRIDTLSMQG